MDLIATVPLSFMCSVVYFHYITIVFLKLKSKHEKITWFDDIRQ